MKVSVTLSIDVDPETWAENYAESTGPSASAVREDVRRYVLSQVQQSAARECGAITFVRLGMASAPSSPTTSG